MERVNDEFEVGYNAQFEQRWYWLELIGRGAMLVITAAALAGLFGQGPFSHRTHEAADHSLAVDFEPVVRHSAPTQVTLHLRPPSGESSQDVLLSASFIEPMGLLRVIPLPLRQRTQDGGLRLTFATRQPVDAGQADQLVRLAVEPNQVGLIALSARVEGGAPLSWHQLVLP